MIFMNVRKIYNLRNFGIQSEELVEEVEEEFEGEDEIQAIEKSADEPEEEVKESSIYTNVFNNDDEI